MTKEELIGRKFTAADKCTYTFYKIGVEDNEDVIWYNWEGSKRGTYQPSTQIMSNLFEEAWKLLPEENKMYKTPKGIEYGVGTQFKHKDLDSDTIYTLTKVPDTIIEKVDMSWKDTPRFTHYSKEEFETNLDSGVWVIITPMKDYKQVDPKTVTFDFTNTKIKVNNEEESKWLLEVGKANGWNVHDSKAYTHLFFYFWPDKDICWGYSLDEDNTYKEITIQDILNNMKEVIEVGDVVEILDTQNSGLYKGHHYAVTGLDYNGTIRIKATGKGENFSWSFDNDAIKLVSKGKKKEITGYETVVDLPGIPKGTKSTDKQFNGNEKVGNFYYTKEELQDTKFFKPIYKQDAIELKFSKYTATLSKQNGLVFTDNEKLEYKELEELVTAINNAKLNLKQGSYKTAIKFEVKEVQVGCKTFTPEDILLAQNGIKDLEKS